MMRPAGRTGSARASVSRSQAGVPDARPTRGGRAPVQWRTASTTATTRVARRTTTVARRIDPAQLPRGVVTGERAPGTRRRDPPRKRRVLRRGPWMEYELAE